LLFERYSLYALLCCVALCFTIAQGNNIVNLFMLGLLRPLLGSPQEYALSHAALSA